MSNLRLVLISSGTRRNIDILSKYGINPRPTSNQHIIGYGLDVQTNRHCVINSTITDGPKFEHVVED